MHLVLLGNGIAGVTAARAARLRAPGARITVVSDEAAHPFSRPALMYLYTGQLTLGQTKLYADGFWGENRIDLVRDRALGLDPAAHRLHLRGGGALAYDRLLIATGSRPAYPAWAEGGLAGVQGFVRLDDVARMEADAARARRAVVVGGGLIGVELAEMLRTRRTPTTLLVRDATYYARVLPEPEGERVGAEIRRHGVDLRLGAEVAALHGDGRVRAVETTDGTTIEADWVGVATGVRPDVSLARDAGLDVDAGLLVDDRLRTSAPDVFAAGDCAQLRVAPPGRPAVEPLWYTARAQGAAAGQNLAGGDAAYAPGVFFNSAKFFDVEWQVYGRVDPQPPDGETALAWAHPDGRRALRLQHMASGSRAVVGVMGLGVRLRHAVCADWIRRGASVEEALDGLGAALFDPELSDDVTAAMAGGGGRPRNGRGWRAWMARLPMNGTTPHALRDSLRHLP